MAIKHWGISERICREYFERIFNEKFPKQRPDWLIYPKTKRKMELDGYCKKLQIAFEYQGKQHYKIHRFYSAKILKSQKKHDISKKKLCKKYMITLIEIPYMIDHMNIGNYIIKKCKQHKIKIPPIHKSLDYKLFNISPPNRLKILRDIVTKKHGKCLSKTYIDSTTKLKFKCQKGHIWESPPCRIEKGGWCQKCAIKRINILRRLTLDDMIRISKKNCGKCLSKIYIDSKTNLKFKCKNGHVWKTKPYIIAQGSWCPTCGIYMRRLTIDEMQNYAKKKQGVCLSKTYKNANSKLQFQCKEGHRWWAKPLHIKNNRWCKRCFYNNQSRCENGQFKSNLQVS